MEKYRRVNNLSLTEAAYIAGIIDGEGTITLTRRHKNAHRQLAVTVSSTELALLDYMLHVIGVGKITTKKSLKSNHSPAFCYQVYNRQALSLLAQTARFLQTYKKKRADIVLQDYLKVTPRNGKYTKGMLKAKAKFTEAFFTNSAPNAKRLP